jgi:hypothetical protein
MGNIIAIAQKELKSYFSSPIAYIVLGLWAFLYGWFFINILMYFVRQSMQMGQFGMAGPQAMNVNQQLIRPLLQNVTILNLFLLPMVTMRTYAEEKRSGTIELLLTSPVTDFQIILGKFFGALRLRPSGVEADRHGIHRALAARRLLRLAGPLDLEPDEESDRGGYGHLRDLPDVLGDHLDRQLLGADGRQADAISVDHRPPR